jgi:hypothetical protein
MFEYCLGKLQVKRESLLDLSNFDFFHGEISFFSMVVEKAIVVEDASYKLFIKGHDCLATGPCLRAGMFNKIDEFMATASLRAAIVEVLFNEKRPLDCYFFRLLAHLCHQLGAILTSEEYNIPISSMLYDRIMKTIMNVVRVVHGEHKQEE